jgi:hypothetical protein
MRRENRQPSNTLAQNRRLNNKNRGSISLHTCVLLAFACKLLLQSLPRAECMFAFRELENQIDVSGQPLEAMEWKRCSGCTR